MGTGIGTSHDSIFFIGRVPGSGQAKVALNLKNVVAKYPLAQETKLIVEEAIRNLDVERPSTL
jgi:hypothetical protein